MAKARSVKRKSRARPTRATAEKLDAAKAKTAVKEETAKAPTAEQIAMRAYQIWMKKGCPADEEWENWLAAEKELREEL